MSKGCRVALVNFFWRLRFLRRRRRRTEIDEIKLEHADSMVVPILHSFHEVRQETTLRKRHRFALGSERISPLKRRVNLYEFVRPEPEARENPVRLALGDPTIRAVGPIRRFPYTIRPVVGEPEGVHHVVIEVHAQPA